MNSNQKNTFLMVTCLAAFYFLYTGYLNRKYPDYAKPKVAQTEAQTTDVASSPKANSTEPTTSLQSTTTTQEQATENGESDSTPTNTSSITTDDARFESDHMIVRFNPNKPSISSIILKNHKDKIKDKESKEITHEPRKLVDSPLNLELFMYNESETESKLTLASGSFSSEKTDSDSITYSNSINDWQITQTFKLKDSGYGFDINLTATNKSTGSQKFVGGLLMREAVKSMTAGGGLFNPGGYYEPKVWRALIIDDGGNYDSHQLIKECNPKKAKGTTSEILEDSKGDMLYYGFDSRYFAKLIIPSEKSSTVHFARSKPTGKHCELSLFSRNDYGQIAAGQSVTINYSSYFGPKDSKVINSIEPNAKSSVYLGWIKFLAKPLLGVINWFYSILGNYGLAIIAVTLLLKLLFYRLTRSAAISGHQLKKIQPKLKAIQAKYKNDRAKLQKEMIGLYKTHKVNPAKSCLPILPTIPVFLAFYQVLMYAFELRQAPFFFWIQDLSIKDPTYILPILLGVLMFFQMKLTPQPGMDKAQQRVMMFMPIMFSFIMITLPSGLVLYMVANSIFTIVQQQIINKKLSSI